MRIHIQNGAGLASPFLLCYLVGMKLTIGTPYTRPFEAEFIDSLFLTKFDGPVGWIRIPGRAVDEGRNLVVDKFLQTDHDFLLMADSDATWHPGAVRRLASRNVPVVCGGMFSRGLPPYPTIGVFKGVEENKQIYQFGPAIAKIVDRAQREGVLETGVDKNEVVFPKREDDLFPVDGCGMHFTLIRRDVLEALSHPYFILDIERMGEDFYFCQKVRKAGFDIYFDTSVYSGHIFGEGSVVGLNEFCGFMKLADNIDEIMEEFYDQGFLDVGGWRV